jgi:hypothetical protein
VGTGVHLWLEAVFGGTSLDKVPMVGPGQERWAVETKLTVGEVGGVPILGTCDLYDRVTATVIDHKTMGKTRLADYTRKGPPEVYRVQVQLYGLGWRRAGLPVDTVMISFLPRDGQLDDAYIWWEPFRPEIARQALDRLNGISQLVQTFGVAALGMLPTTDEWCFSCPYLRLKSDDLGRGCPGDPGMYQPNLGLTIKEGSGHV